MGASAELRSLKLQAERRALAHGKARIPSGGERAEIIERTVAAYSPSVSACPDWIKFGWDREKASREFERILPSVNEDAGAGVPYAFLVGGIRPLIGAWIEDPMVLQEVWDTVVNRLLRLMDYEFISPERAVQDCVCDPIRLFVKNEPHKLKKLEEGRYRLIASVSMVDQLVARMLFGIQNKCELRNFRMIPSQPGMGLSNDEQTSDFISRLANLAGTTSVDLVENYRRWCIPTDCSGFDWSVPAWLMEDDLEVRNRLTIDISPELVRMRANWLKCITNSVVYLSDGSLLAQTSPGIQKSGSYNTSSTNSRVRFMMSLYAGAPWCVAMGDDAVEGVGADLSKYSELGFVCEEAAVFDFCSHVFKSPTVAVPTNVGKMLVKLLSTQDPDVNREVWHVACLSVLSELRHIPAPILTEVKCALGLDR